MIELEGAHDTDQQKLYAFNEENLDAARIPHSCVKTRNPECAPGQEKEALLNINEKRQET
jgi:hypothetical protein